MNTLGRTAEEYLATLPDDRQLALEAVRDVIVEALPAGYEEHLRATAIYYEIPRRAKPLIYAGLASQKHYMTVYLRALYYDPDLNDGFVARWRAGGTPLDMGKGCVRFRSLAEVDLDLIADTVAAYEVADYLRLHASFRS